MCSCRARGTHRWEKALRYVAALELDDPLAAQWIGGEHVRPVVTRAPRLPGARVAVAVHQVAYRALEVAVMQDVQL